MNCWIPERYRDFHRTHSCGLKMAFGLSSDKSGWYYEAFLSIEDLHSRYLCSQHMWIFFLGVTVHCETKMMWATSMIVPSPSVYVWSRILISLLDFAECIVALDAH
jgi:hypothetical protein